MDRCWMDLLGDTLINTTDTVDVIASVTDTAIVSAGAVTVGAMAMSQVNATTSNSVSSTSSTLFGGKSAGASGVFSSNKISSNARAIVDDLDDDVTNPTSIAANGAVEITASDDSQVYANSKVVSSSITTNDGGANIVDDLTGYLYDVEFVTDGVDVSNDRFELGLTLGLSVLDPTMVDLKFGDHIRLTDGFSGVGGTGGSVYKYLGSGTLATPDQVDFETTDFADQDLWKEVQGTQIIPTGNNISPSDSYAVGGIAVLNDVSGEVEARVEDSSIEATDGNILVSAGDNGLLSAKSDSTASSSGGSAWGTGNSIAVNATISTNVLQGGATATVLDGSLTTLNTGDITVAAVNAAELIADTLQSTTTGDTAGSFLVAFNSIGYEGQNILFNVVDTFIGNRIGNQTVSDAVASVHDSEPDVGRFIRSLGVKQF